MERSVVFTADLVAQPAANFMRSWGLDPASDNDHKTLNNWCLMGKVPGAFKGPNGAWWVNPLAMLSWGQEDGQSEGQRVHRDKKKGA